MNPAFTAHVSHSQVGDRLDTDILWANTVGMGSLLVMTGEAHWVM